jgi:hypothetical protein
LRSTNSTFFCARNSRAARHPVQVGFRYSVVAMAPSLITIRNRRDPGAR